MLLTRHLLIIVMMVLGLFALPATAQQCGTPYSTDWVYQPFGSEGYPPPMYIAGVTKGGVIVDDQWTRSIYKVTDTGTKRPASPTSTIFRLGVDEYADPMDGKFRFKLTDKFSVSEDSGKTWVDRSIPRALLHNAPASATVRMWIVGIIAQPSRRLFARAQWRKNDLWVDVPALFTTTNAGRTWTQIANVSDPARLPLTMAGNDRVLLAYADAGFLRSMDGGTTWSLLPVDKALLSLVNADVNPALKEAVSTEWGKLGVSQLVFTSKAEEAYAVTNKGLFKTTDAGSTWRYLDTGRRQLDFVNSIAWGHGKLFVATDRTILLSEDGGCSFRTLHDRGRG